MPLKQKYITDEQGNQIGILLDIDLAISEEEEIPFEEAIAEIENSRQ